MCGGSDQSPQRHDVVTASDRRLDNYGDEALASLFPAWQASRKLQFGRDQLHIVGDNGLLNKAANFRSKLLECALTFKLSRILMPRPACSRRPVSLSMPRATCWSLRRQPISFHVPHVAGRLCFSPHDRPGRGAVSFRRSSHDRVNNERRKRNHMAIKLRRHAPRDQKNSAWPFVVSIPRLARMRSKRELFTLAELRATAWQGRAEVATPSALAWYAVRAVKRGRPAAVA